MERRAERKETGDYTLSITGNDVKSMTQSLVAVSYTHLHTGRRGRPAKHGKQLSVETDFTFSGEKIQLR